MADDIVGRLQYAAWLNPSEGDTAEAHFLAADALAEIERLRAENDRLQRWQREALLVMTDWDIAYQRSGVQAFGVTKAAALLDEIERLRADLAAAYCRMDDMEGLNDD